MTAVALRFVPLPKQREFLEATEPEVLYSGAFGAGKSRALCEKIHFLLAYYPGNVGLLARKYFSDLGPTTLKTLLEEVIPPSHIIEHHRTEHRIVVRTDDPDNPSTLYYRGLDRPTGVASMNLGFAAVDEVIECDEDEWIMLEGRLRLNRVPFHQLFAATNPGAPTHWVYKRFVLNVPKDKSGAYLRRAVMTTALDNEHNPPAYRERLARFQGIFRERFVEGKWVGAEGLVYPEFDPTKHVVSRFEIPADWPRWRAIDYGTANPTVILWGAKNPASDQLVIYREIYRSGLRMKEHAQRAKLLSKGETFQDTVSDHDLTERKEFEAEGILTAPAKKDVHEGIQKVKARLAVNSTTGKPGVVFFDDALVEVDTRLEMEGLPTRTTDEFGGYKWATGAHETTKDEPLKKNDHGVDALRYLIMRVDASVGYGVKLHPGFNVGGFPSPRGKA